MTLIETISGVGSSARQPSRFWVCGGVDIPHVYPTRSFLTGSQVLAASDNQDPKCQDGRRRHFRIRIPAFGCSSSPTNVVMDCAGAVYVNAPPITGMFA